MLMKRIAELRKEKNYSQKYLAYKLGISQKTVSGYENDRNKPNIEMLIKISEVFNTSIDYIVENSNIKEPINKVLDGELTKEEKEMLILFKKLSYPDQLRANGMLRLLAEEAKK